MHIVSLCPSVTELICDLGLAEALVGVTGHCVHLADVAGIEDVGDTKDPRIVRIVELKPDVVLLTTRRRTAARTPRPSSRRGCAATSPGPARRPRPLPSGGAHRPRRRGAQRARAPRGPRRPAVPWAYLIWRKPWMTVNADTFVDALLTQAGGANVFGGNADRYPTVSAEEIAAAGSAAVFLSTEPFPFEEKHVDELAGATGLARERFRIGYPGQGRVRKRSKAGCSVGRGSLYPKIAKLPGFVPKEG